MTQPVFKIEITAPPAPGFDTILTPAALDFVGPDLGPIDARSRGLQTGKTDGNGSNYDQAGQADERAIPATSTFEIRSGDVHDIEGLVEVINARWFRQ